jgi:3-(3-hydroxy-phenyl)propionate hydroxylase
VTVLIAGAGPVGLTLAGFLGREGVPVTVFEQGPALSELSQASTFHASTLELLDEIDMAWPLIDTGKITQRLQYRDRREGLLAEFNFAPMKGVTKFPIRLQSNQTELTRLLLEEIRRRYPTVEVRFATKVLSARVTGADAIVSTQASAGGEGGNAERAGTVEHHASVAVAADGAGSAVRKSLGIEFQGSTYLTRHLMITTSYDVLAHMPELSPVTYIFDGMESMGILILKDVSRVVFIVQGDESDEEILRPSALQARLREFLPPHDGDYPILSARIARLHQRVADRYVEGPIALAGDAAHLNHPLGGMGLNAGIHDAYALTGAILRHLDGEDLALELYGKERRQEALLHVIPTADSYASAAGENDEEACRRRNRELKETAEDPAKALEYVLKASMFDSMPKRRSAG